MLGLRTINLIYGEITFSNNNIFLNTHNNIIIYIKITLKSKTTVAHLYE